MKLHRHDAATRTAISLSPRAVLSISLSFAIVFSYVVDSAAFAAIPAKDKKTKEDSVLKGLPVTDLTADEAVLHALNRLAYGPRPGDIDRIKRMGLAKWLEQQLDPQSMDDQVLEARLESYPTLKMSTAKLLEEYPQPKQAAKQSGLTKEEYRQQQAEKRRADAAASAASAPAPAEKMFGDSKDIPKDVKSADDAAAPMKQPPAAGTRNLLSVDPNSEPRVVADDSKRPQRVIAELSMAKVTRAIYSERQLQQVMGDFWFNHFNVYAPKGGDKWLLTAYERDVIQPHTLGKFKDLLTATAKSPAMLFYLDNFLSADPRAQERLAAERMARQSRHYGRFGGPFPPRPRPNENPQAQNKKKGRGLNENYGRELMELHTLGVDGGYTQKDVTEVARCFTGWTIDKPRENAAFKFDDRLHDPGPKVVLGRKIHAGGMKDGEQVLDLLAKHPSTAKFISTKLARRFVSDDPPASLVDKMSRTFRSTDGDIRAVLRTMIYSPEFWSRGAYRAKIKTPFELVVSTARALGTEVDTALPLVQWVGRIGEPLYQCQPPTGYSDKADAWVNTGALLNRLNFSLALAGNKLRGSRSDTLALLGAGDSDDPKPALNRAVQVFLSGQISDETVRTLEAQLDNPQVLQARLDDPVKRVDVGVVAGLVLGAPEFQRR